MKFNRLLHTIALLAAIACSLNLYGIADAFVSNGDHVYAEEPSEHESPESPEAPGEEPEEDHSKAKKLSALLIVVILILVSLAFEWFRDFLDEKVPKSLLPILESLWEELTGFGFLSLSSALIVKSKVLDKISQKVFGHEEEAELDELLESIHLILFVVFVVFLVQVLVVVYLSILTIRNWRAAEKDVKNRERVFANYQNYLDAKAAGKVGFCAPSALGKAKHRMEYLMLRDAFIKGRQGQHELSGNFDYARYLSKILGHTVAHTVHVGFYVWLSTLVLFVIVWAIDQGPDTVQVCFGIGIGWVMVGIAAVVLWKMNSIREKLLPAHFELPTDGELINEEAPLSATGFTDPAYLSNQLRSRSKIGEWLLGAPANKHELLFWFERKGPAFLLNVIRALLLFQSLYVAIMYFELAPSVWTSFHEENVMPRWAVAVIFALAIIPVLIINFFFSPYLVRRHVVISNIEMLKNVKEIHHVVRHQRTQSGIRVLKLLNMLKFQSKKLEEHKKDGDSSPKKKDTKEKKPAHNDHQLREEMKEVFELFDKDGDGTISVGELKGFLTTLGHPMSDEEAQQIIFNADVNGDGVLDLDEFCAYMSDFDQNDDPEEMIEAMFKMFDQDNSGSITTAEFRHILERIGSSLSKEDIDEIIRELDENEDGHIDLKEFAEMIEKFTKE